MQRRNNSWCQLCAATGALITAASSAAFADGKPTFDIYGFAQADGIYDVDRVDPTWEDTLRPSKIPTEEGVFGSDGQTLFSAKQSRFGVKGDIPVDSKMGDITFKFEFDMFGVGVDAGQTTIRLRHAYGEWGPLLAGQTNSLFMDGDVFPNVVDYWGPSGMVFLRNPQIRYTFYRGESDSFAVALEKPANDTDVGQIRTLDPSIGNNITDDQKLPDLTAHYNISQGWGHFQIAGILRRVGFNTLNVPDNRPKGSELGWGVDVTGHVNVWGTDKLIGGVVFGDGIANYMNDGGVDLAAKGSGLGDIKATAVPLVGVIAYLDHYWNSKKSLSTSIGYSFTQVDNQSLQDDTAFRKGEYASVNLLYTPVKNFLVGGELLWGQREDKDHSHGDDVRFQFTVKYDFGASISL